MKTYEVTFEYLYPDSDDDIRVAITEAESFNEAEEKVVKAMKGTFESARITNIEVSDKYII